MILHSVSAVSGQRKPTPLKRNEHGTHWTRFTKTAVTDVGCCWRYRLNEKWNLHYTLVCTGKLHSTRKTHPFILWHVRSDVLFC